MRSGSMQNNEQFIDKLKIELKFMASIQEKYTKNQYNTNKFIEHILTYQPHTHNTGHSNFSSSFDNEADNAFACLANLVNILNEYKEISENEEKFALKPNESMPILRMFSWYLTKMGEIASFPIERQGQQGNNNQKPVDILTVKLYECFRFLHKKIDLGFKSIVNKKEREPYNDFYVVLQASVYGSLADYYLTSQNEVNLALYAVQQAQYFLNKKSKNPKCKTKSVEDVLHLVLLGICEKKGCAKKLASQMEFFLKETKIRQNESSRGYVFFVLKFLARFLSALDYLLENRIWQYFFPKLEAITSIIEEIIKENREQETLFLKEATFGAEKTKISFHLSAMKGCQEKLKNLLNKGRRSYFFNFIDSYASHINSLNLEGFTIGPTKYPSLCFISNRPSIETATQLQSQKKYEQIQIVHIPGCFTVSVLSQALFEKIKSLCFLFPETKIYDDKLKIDVFINTDKTVRDVIENAEEFRVKILNILSEYNQALVKNTGQQEQEKNVNTEKQEEITESNTSKFISSQYENKNTFTPMCGEEKSRDEIKETNFHQLENKVHQVRKKIAAQKNKEDKINQSTKEEQYNWRAVKKEGDILKGFEIYSKGKDITSNTLFPVYNSYLNEVIHYLKFKDINQCKKEIGSEEIYNHYIKILKKGKMVPPQGKKGIVFNRAGFFKVKDPLKDIRIVTGKDPVAMSVTQKGNKLGIYELKQVKRHDGGGKLKCNFN